MAEIARWLAAKLNRMTAPVRFLLPEGGVSATDVEGQPFFDPEADRVLFETLQAALEPSPNRRLVRVPAAINDPAFAAAVVAAFREITTGA